MEISAKIFANRSLQTDPRLDLEGQETVIDKSRCVRRCVGQGSPEPSGGREEFYYEGLSHVIMELRSPTICHQQAGDQASGVVPVRG